ncbi:5-methyltetrahydropteroyltriglutamate--homocysteine S-methyltransferase [Enterococcus devriesei]|uniref:5-methyltetrahydropteroyltriglutamate-- homocysteine S-methyltransferase n=1 Tax=Enterococcus devriesei TaxID=319970 RepID=UPI00289165F0|nr:5-methyltetrahydropteroyltriglutamate--homocysteine S-methyltransferase [Enterococcus devriesei]MDT2820730.1 5-methyltetrahydropteroyltriglutamate--homocysteine S-methyltransferase [Enterococcus devriesei]
MKTSIVGYPRIGEHRELKFAIEKYFKNDLTADELMNQAKELRKNNWKTIKASGVEAIPSNDFSFYDTTLDTACLLNIIPQELAKIELSELDTYFALARGYQGAKGDIKARPMKKWFNTNYHYIVPKIEKETKIEVVGSKIFDEYQEAKALGIETRPVILGPFSLLQISEFDTYVDRSTVITDLIQAYKIILQKLTDLNVEWVQIDEPSLTKDLNAELIAEFQVIYRELLKDQKINVLAQTYFGDVRDIYDTLIELPFAGIGLDFVEGRKTLALVKQYFPKDKYLFAGVVNGKNIWRNNYQQTLADLATLKLDKLVFSTSCSLLHVPYTTKNEPFPIEIKQYFAFAAEKLTEVVELAESYDNPGPTLSKNQLLFSKPRFTENQAVHQKIAELTPAVFTRLPNFEKREKIQREHFAFPALPTTTIGSFPQTLEIKQMRAKLKKAELSLEEYDQFIAQHINQWLDWQTEIGLDVLVHGEFERNDMVEYFGQNLSGYLFSQNGWVQSYGTRCVKPPIIWGDVSREKPITVKWSAYAQQQTNKIVKGMLTGPVTILNWSFPREDISLKESTLQIALAIQEEVLDLEKNGIQVIQIDEAALREKLPLRQTDWYTEYLDWAIPAFRLVHSQVQATTQIHTHMCYSEFTDIISAIDQMDADVISFEAARSNLTILDELQKQHFKTEVGPGVYDIHSPRVPSVAEITSTIQNILSKIPVEKTWINPDCGLKTRGIPEAKESLMNMTTAVNRLRKEL